MKKHFVFCFLVLGWLFLSLVPSVKAQSWQGHFYYTPINFTNKQVVTDLSTDLEVAALDIYDKYEPKNEQNTFVVNQKFRFQAHQDLPGATCIMLNETSTDKGRVKARCSATAYGRFVFHIESVTANEIPNSAEFEIIFSKDKAPKPSPTAKLNYKMEVLPGADGPCASSMKEASIGGDFWCGENGINGYIATCRNGYRFKITLDTCRSSREDNTTVEADIICADPRCEPLKPSLVPKAVVLPFKASPSAVLNEKQILVATPSVQLTEVESTLTTEVTEPAVALKAPSVLVKVGNYFENILKKIQGWF